MPAIIVRNRQRLVPVKLPSLQQFAEGALTACLNCSGRNKNVLSKLIEVTVVLVSDHRMADLHRRFLNEFGPTDVITFQHGEIVISTETARRQGRAFRTSVEHEVRLYLVHGLLHLRGYDDKTPAGAAEMKRIQEKVVRGVDRARRRPVPESGGETAPINIARRSPRSTVLPNL